ncbi:MAG: hypothetical protein OXH51_00630 [Gemmatimonadetes bacterium]|nr:hypothetical protein [Gemmatimonadota bacterium]
MIRSHRGPLLVGLLVIVSALAFTPALRDAATLQPFPPATLHHPPGYLLGAPLFGFWDTLTLLTVSQHQAFLATLVLMYAAWRVVAARAPNRRQPGPARHPDAGQPRSRSAGGRRSLPRRIAREALLAATALAALLAFYAAAALVPRPMAAIRLASPDLVAVDFHSHTNRSHDGWVLFTAARNRAWHEAGGFHAAYVTDHYTWAGVDEALPANPARAGDRTVLLSGMEVRLRDRHTNILGDRARYVFALDSTWHHLDPDSIAAAYSRGAPPATMLYAIPGPLDRIVPFGPGSPAGVVGVELSDGAPRGLEQGRAEREETLALADSLDLAVVAGTNNHGWGRTVPAWNVMRLPGWPHMSPDELGSAIEDVLHRERRRAVTVVERTMPYHDGSAVKLAATVPLLLWSHFRTLTLGERVSWLVWVAIWAAVRAHRGRHHADP